MNSDSTQPAEKARLFHWKRTGTNLPRPAFVAMYCVLVFFFCFTVVGEIIAAWDELGVFAWIFVVGICVIPTAWLSVRLKECYTMGRPAADTHDGSGINVDTISHQLRRIRQNYLVPLAARHCRPGHNPERVASARCAVRSRSFFGSRPFDSHEETHEPGYEI
jgi:hypothetical protein